MSESTMNGMNETARATSCEEMPGGRLRTRERWRGLIAEQRRCGESKAAFCRGRGISYTSFLYWAKRFAEEGEPGRRADEFHEMGVGTSGVFAFSVAGAAYEIVSGGVVVRVSSGFDVAELSRLLRAVFGASRSFEEESRSVGVASGSTVNGSCSAVNAIRSTGAPSRSTVNAIPPAGEATRPC